MPHLGHTIFQRQLSRALCSSLALPLSPMPPSLISKFLSSIAFPRFSTLPSIVAPSKEPLYPKLYTSGRWLHRDEEQHASRYINFDFQALCEKVLILHPEASHIVSYEKKEGGYNKVFIFLLNNGERIVARLPTRAAGPRTLTTNSEVATIAYVKAHTTIPVPHILDWSDDPGNPIGCEYIIMKHVEGVQLQQRWPSMSGSQYTRCVQSVCMSMKQLAALDFPAYGSLYFEDASFDSTFKIPFVDGFCIGPHCSTTYWDCNVTEAKSEPTATAGPWQDLAAYASGIIANGYSKLPTTGTDILRPSYFGTVEEHLSLLRSAQDVLQNLILQPQIKDAAAPTLLHADLNARNIYVSDDDPTIITCLIDWQSSSIEPAFIYASEVPDFATAPTQQSEEKSFDEATHTQEPPLSKEDIKLQKVASYCSEAYDICTKSFIPRMRIARSVDQLLVRPFQYSNNSWRDSATALRQEFLDLGAHWEDMGLSGQCPYSPTPEELKLHQKNYKAFEHVQELKLMLIKLLGTDSDGWVPVDRWEEVRRAHKKIFDLALETAREDTDDQIGEDDVRELWPFDDWRYN